MTEQSASSNLGHWAYRPHTAVRAANENYKTDQEVLAMIFGYETTEEPTD